MPQRLTLTLSFGKANFALKASGLANSYITAKNKDRTPTGSSAFNISIVSDQQLLCGPVASEYVVDQSRNVSNADDSVFVAICFGRCFSLGQYVSNQGGNVRDVNAAITIHVTSCICNNKGHVVNAKFENPLASGKLE